MKNIYFKIAFAITVFLAFTVKAQTTVPGGFVSGTWNLAGSPYNVTGSIQVANNTTLTIDPGVTVSFQGHYKFLVLGTLLAVGNITDSVRFTAQNTTTGWFGIRFANTPLTNDSSKFKFCSLQWGKANGTSDDACGGAFFVKNFSKVNISNSLISNNIATNYGGGVYIISCSPLINGCTIKNNVSTNAGGGGIYFENSGSTISRNIIVSNTGNAGGGIFTKSGSPLTILNNTITSNSSGNSLGGGIYSEYSSVIIDNNVISNNVSPNGGGAGITCTGFADIKNNIISSNTSGSYHGGGGLYCSGSTSNISKNLICNNSNSGSTGGGGIYCTNSSSSFTITGNVIVNNSALNISASGGGIYFDNSNPLIINNTVVNNNSIRGGAFYCTNSSPICRNNVLYGNTASTSGNQVFLLDENSDPSFYYCDVEGGAIAFEINSNFYTGTYTNNINSNPLFVSPSGGAGTGFNGLTANWSLQAGSPCIDTGDPATTAPATDIAGNPRVTVCRVDMGAYEYQNGAPLIINIVQSKQISCNGTNTGELVATASGGFQPYTFLWNGGSTNDTLSNLPIGTYTVNVGNASGCSRTATFTITQPPVLNISTSFTNTSCGNTYGSAIATVSGGTGPYYSQWSNGDIGLTADSLAAGQYAFQVTDAYGCYNSKVLNINTTNGPSIAVNTLSNVNCPGGNNGSISISASGGVGPYTYLWSNGVTTSSVASLYSGVYDITVTDANNCIAVKTYTVSQPAALSINFTSTSASCGSSNGSLTANVFGGTSPYNYQWSANAASQTTVTAINLSAGIYSCVVTDNKGCQISGTGAVASATSGPTLSFVTTNASGCGSSNGGTIDMTVTGGSSFTYQWSNGATSQDINGLAPGNYQVVVTNTNNCSSTASVAIQNGSGNTNPSVCIVTVDTLTNTNKLVWEKPATANGIKLYKIYREGSALGVYNLIHSQNFTTLSEYTDPTANPAVRGWRYKITYEDSCGNETALSMHHKTIHLMVNKGLGNVMNLTWDQYEGFGYVTFYVWRKHASTGWVQLTALPANLFSYTDLTPPGVGTLRYMIELGPTSGYVCNSTAKNINTNINTTRSNTKDNFVTELLTGVKENEGVIFDLFPNPVNELLNIYTNNKVINSVKILDVTGRLLQQEKLENKATHTQINTANLVSGMYFIEIQTKDGVMRKPFVKE